MKIAGKLTSGCRFISLEYFPPKERQDWPAFFQVAERLASLVKLARASGLIPRKA